MEWYYLDDAGQEFGPYSGTTMKKWYDDGFLPGSDLMLRLPRWKVHRRLDELYSDPAAYFIEIPRLPVGRASPARSRSRDRLRGHKVVDRQPVLHPLSQQQSHYRDKPLERPPFDPARVSIGHPAPRPVEDAFVAAKQQHPVGYASLPAHHEQVSHPGSPPPPHHDHRAPPPPLYEHSGPPPQGSYAEVDPYRHPQYAANGRYGYGPQPVLGYGPNPHGASSPPEYGHPPLHGAPPPAYGHPPPHRPPAPEYGHPPLPTHGHPPLGPPPQHYGGLPPHGPPLHPFHAGMYGPPPMRHPDAYGPQPGFHRPPRPLYPPALGVPPSYPPHGGPWAGAPLPPGGQLPPGAPPAPLAIEYRPPAPVMEGVANQMGSVVTSVGPQKLSRRENKKVVTQVQQAGEDLDASRISVFEFLGIVSGHTGEMQEGTMTTALHILAKSCKSQPENIEAVKAHPLFVSFTAALLPAVREALELLGQSPKGKKVFASIASVCWSFAILGIPNASFFDEVMLKIIPHLQEFKHIQVSNILWAIGKLRDSQQTKHHVKLFQAMGTEVLDKPDAFNIQSLSMIIWAFANVRVKHCKLFSFVADRVAGNAEAAECQEMASIVWGFSRVKFFHRGLFNRVGDEAVARMADFKPAEVGTTAWAFGRARFRHLGFFESLDQCFRELSNTYEGLGKFGARQIALILGAVSSLYPARNALLADEDSDDDEESMLEATLNSDDDVEAWPDSRYDQVAEDQVERGRMCAISLAARLIPEGLRKAEEFRSDDDRIMRRAFDRLALSRDGPPEGGYPTLYHQKAHDFAHKFMQLEEQSASERE